jgi:methionine-rich copper-binding protein CopC
MLLNDLRSKIQIMINFLLVALILFATHANAAGTSCPASTTGDDGIDTSMRGIDVRSGSCGAFDLTPTSYSSAGDGGFATASFPFTAFLPDTAPSLSAARFIMHNGTSEVSFSSVTCTGATVSSLNTFFIDITLTNGTSCTLTIGGDSDTIGYTGATLSRSATGVYSLTAGTLLGGNFGGTFSSASVNSDATLTDGSGVNEPVDLPTTADTVGEAVDLLDFTITDGGTSDGLSTDVSEIFLSLNNNQNIYSKVTWRLNGPDADNIIGTYDANQHFLSFKNLTISIPDGSNETYTINGYFNDASGITDNESYELTLGTIGAITLAENKTQFAMASTVSSTGGKATVTASQLIFSTQPAGSVSGIPLTTQPTIQAVDAGNNVDVDYSGTISLTEGSAGSLGGTTSKALSSGSVTFDNVKYNATADQEAFTLRAISSGTGSYTVDANAVTSDVVATQLDFVTQPAPITLLVNTTLDFSTDPIVHAVDDRDIVDTGFSGVVTLRKNGLGIGTFSNHTANASNGIATFTGLTLKTDELETFQLQANANVNGVQSSNSRDLHALSNQAATIANTSANQAVNDNATLTPFSAVTLADSENDNLSVTLSLDNNAKGSLSTTSIASNTITNVQTALRAIIFTPAENRVAVGSTETTTITLTVNDGTTDTTDNVTTIVSTSMNDTPTDIALSSNSVNQSGGANAVVGALSSTDADTGESFTYSRVAGTGDTDNSHFNIDGANLRLTNPNALSAGSYSVRIQTNDGHSATFAKAFTITVVDDVSPTLLILSPADNATGVAIDTNLELTFSEVVSKGSGNLVIYKGSSYGSQLESIDITGSNVTISPDGKTVTVNPTTTMEMNTGYHIVIDASALRDAAGNGNAAISGATAWNFTTVADSTPPTITAVSIPNSPMKIGDTVTATITVSSDSDDYTTGSGAISGTIGGFAVGGLSKTNDTTYTATFTLTNGGTDVASDSNILVSIRLTDSAGNQSTAFTTAISQNADPIDANKPTLSEITAVDSLTTDTTPDYTFSSDEAGTITYGGNCSSSTTNANSGNNTVTFNALSLATHSNCKITVTDAAGNASNHLSVPVFQVVDAIAPEIDVTNSSGSTSIATGDTSPRSLDGTDFGTQSTTKTFTIKNTGNADLILSGSPLVALSSKSSPAFRISAQPPSPTIGA